MFRIARFYFGLHLLVHALDAALSTYGQHDCRRGAWGSHSARILVSCPPEGIGFQINSP